MKNHPGLDVASPMLGQSWSAGRCLAATRGDILCYFHSKNFLIVTLGVGVILAVVLNLLLMQHYEVPRLPLW